MSAIRTAAFAIWLISIVIAFEFGISVPERIDQLPGNNNIPIMFFIFLVSILFLHFIGIVRVRWDSDKHPLNLGVFGNLVERERLENFVLAVQPTKLLIVCAATIGLVGLVRTATTSQDSLSYICSAFFLVVSAWQFYAYIRHVANIQPNDDA